MRFQSAAAIFDGMSEYPFIARQIMKNRRIEWPILAVMAVALFLAPAASAQEINEKLASLNLGIAGIAIDMPDGQYVGERTGRTLETYRWDVELTPDDRVSDDRLLGLEHFEFAGVPVVPGTEVSVTEGIFGPERFRLAGVLVALDIRGSSRLEVRTEVVWSIYDAEAGEVIAEFKSKGLAKGTVLGFRGEQPNALLDSVIHSLEEFLDDKGEDAIKDARG